MKNKTNKGISGYINSRSSLPKACLRSSETSLLIEMVVMVLSVSLAWALLEKQCKKEVGGSCVCVNLTRKPQLIRAVSNSFTLVATLAASFSWRSSTSSNVYTKLQNQFITFSFFITAKRKISAQTYPVTECYRMKAKWMSQDPTA